ncbi:MAG: polysaccharide pyruvyl transferase family protein [Ruminococcus flavefaciens]|nr:polysaccharide pyruvyl transferase family protein [Ruminococcus flavefaciens]
MRIGILTYHKSLNNGSALQAYALKTTLQKMGYEVNIIDYTPKKYKEIYGFLSFNGSMKLINRILLFFKRIWFLDMFLSNKSKYSNFQKNNLALSEKKYFYNSNFEALNDEYDVLITGSDQIWNTVCDDCDLIYFLPMSHKARKIAYAPSCNDTKKYSRKYIQLLSDYDCISVREQSGKKTLDLICPEKKIRVLADPTFLLEKSDFENLYIHRIVKQDYIFLYSVKYSDDVIEASHKLSRKLNLPVYTIVLFPRIGIIIKLSKASIKFKRFHNGPVDFLSYIKYAKYVISDSFHGTAFSIIYNKPFYSINIKKEDGLTNDERICTLLGKLGLNDHYLSADVLSNIESLTPINYNEVKKKQTAYAHESIEWLRKAVEGNVE